MKTHLKMGALFENANILCFVKIYFNRQTCKKGVKGCMPLTLFCYSAFGVIISLVRTLSTTV